MGERTHWLGKFDGVFQYLLRLDPFNHFQWFVEFRQCTAESRNGRLHAFLDRVETKPPAQHETLDWALIGGYVGLIALFAGAHTVPAFRSIVSNVFFKVNDLVRALFGV